MSTHASLSSKLSIEPTGSALNLERLSSSRATYGDLVDAFARELSMDEILLISGASKSGGGYSGGGYS
jgi:hypothetical protein